MVRAPDILIDIEPGARPVRRICYLLAVGLAILASAAGMFFTAPKTLLWNRTASAPLGIYWLSSGPYTAGRWAAVSARSEPALWASTHGYAGTDWLLLKQIAAVEGDEVCRDMSVISVNGRVVSEAREHDSSGNEMPAWQGCMLVEGGEVFLLNDHPSSLDGRYFGVTRQDDLVGVAIPLMIWSD